MKRLVIIFAMVFLFAATSWAAVSSVNSGSTGTTPQLQPSTPVGLTPLVGACCITGKYLGTNTDTVCKPGQTPKKGKFTMDITQSTRCGGTLTAKVTDAEDGKITTFKGTVVPGPAKGCCTIDGVSTSGTDNIHFQGTLCKKILKWEANGSFKSNQCKGVWEMKQL
jgi:uncharacterized protein (DUF2147 family)